MKHQPFLGITLNFFAVILLVSLIAAPLYFAQNFAKVAGVKTQTAYLITSQVAKFPNMTLNQDAESFQISFTKQAQSQAYLSVLILTNPAEEAKSYSIIQTASASKVFFGEDLKNTQTSIKVPPSTSVPISLISTSDGDSQTIEFTIDTD